MKSRPILSLTGLCLLYLMACTKGGELASGGGNSYTVSSQLSSKKVFPAQATDTSSGVFTGWYDEALNNLTYRFTYVKDTTIIKLDTLKVIRMFKTPANAADTASASRRFVINTSIAATSKTNLTGAFNLGISGNNGLLPDEQASFLSGSWYMILYSAKFPNGLIGGPLAVMKSK